LEVTSDFGPSSLLAEVSIRFDEKRVVLHHNEMPTELSTSNLQLSTCNPIPRSAAFMPPQRSTRSTPQHFQTLSTAMVWILRVESLLVFGLSRRS
jgi:hypothetical protein